VDLVEGLLEIARERARQEGLENVAFQVADAEALDVGEKTFDVATLRWGLMYMRAPQRALTSIHRALVPGGTLVIASWAEPARVPFASLPRRLLGRYRDVPPLATDGPGVFRHADPSSLESALERSGFAPVASQEMNIPVVEGRDGRDILAWVRQLGGPVVKLADEMPRHLQQAWEEDLVCEVEQGRVGGSVCLGGVTRLTLARARES
jgi:SAM-dependent methyltransferase